MTRLTEFKNLSATLKGLDTEDTLAFHAAVDHTAKLLEISDVALSKLLGVSRPSLQRWRSGTHAPHPFIRAKLIELLRGEVQQRAKTLAASQRAQSRRAPSPAERGAAQFADAE